MQNAWEVEQKYVVQDVVVLLDRLQSLGAIPMETENHVDTYLKHPSRDFKVTDEAFRIRQVDSKAFLTYKGKRLPGSVKTRPEIELAIHATETSQWLEMLQHLGFQPVRKVRKHRRIFILRSSAITRANTNNAGDFTAPAFESVTVAMDRVEELGDFVEIELLIADLAQIDAARAHIEETAASLGLSEVQPRSYLSQLVAKFGE